MFKLKKYIKKQDSGIYIMMYFVKNVKRNISSLSYVLITIEI